MDTGRKNEQIILKLLCEVFEYAGIQYAGSAVDSFLIGEDIKGECRLMSGRIRGIKHVKLGQRRFNGRNTARQKTQRILFGQGPELFLCDAPEIEMFLMDQGRHLPVVIFRYNQIKYDCEIQIRVIRNI